MKFINLISPTWKDITQHYGSLQAINLLNITLPLRITMVSPLNQTYSTSSILFNVSLNNDGDTCKFSLDNWLTNITMTKLTTTNFNFTNSSIADGSYTSKFWCNDTIGSVNYTTSIDFSKDASNPLIYFTNPTPPSGINYSNSHIINITIIEKDLSQFIWNWNSTNYTYYNNSLLVMLGFNNFSGIGDNLTNVADSSLYSQNGTLMGNAFFNCTSGMFGCAIDLDGTGDWVNVSYKGGYNSIQFSVCAWAFKKVNVSHASIASDYVNGGGGRNFILGYEYPDNTLAFGFGDGTAFDWIYGNYSEKKWHYVCGVFNNFTHELSIYIDSVNNTKITFINKSGGIPSVVTAVGKYTELFYFNGLIDEFRIWNRSLTSLEIQEMYNSNLYKYNSTLWMFTSNHTNLAWGSNRTYQAFAYDIYGNSNSTEMRELNISLLQALDTFYPQFNSYQVSPANNSAYLAGLLNFNTTILQTNGTAGIQFNGVNYSMINSSSQDIFNKTLGTIGVGDYVYYFWAYGNGTSGLYNTTQLFEYIIAKRDATYGLNITGTTPIGYPQVTNVDKSENNTEDIDCIYAVDIANDLFGVDASPITFNYSTAGCSNYTAGSITKAITITQNTTQTSLTFDKTSPQSYPTLITPTCSFIQGAGTLSLANGTSGVASQLGADTWYFNCSFIGDNNYTASSNFTSFTITQNSTYVFAITGTTPIIYGTISDVAGSGCPSELSCSMDMDNVVYGVEVSPLEFNYSTAGNNNYSANSITKDITINKGTQSLTALLNGASDNVTGTYPYPMNFSFSGTNYTAVKIYVNQLEVTPHINYTYGGGSYIINYSASSNQNYSAYNYWLNFTIQQASQTPISLLNGVENNLTLTYPTQINASFYNNDTEMIVSIANQIITPHLNYTYGSSHYVVNFTAISNQNYSEFIYFMNFTINKASSQTSLIFDKTTPQDYGTSITPTCSIFIGGNEALSLTNGTSGLAETLGVGAWNFNCSYAGNTNYSANSNFTTFTINQANSPITLLINGTAGNQTAPFGAGTNVSAYINNNEQTIFLLNNSIDSTNSNHLFNTLGIGSYNFTAYVDASQNYSYQTLTRWSHILDVTPPMVAILGPTNTTYNYSVINLNITNSSDAQAVWYMNSTGNFSYTIPLYFNLTNGAYTLFAYANDSVNNVNETKVSFYVNYTAPDTTAPDIYIDSPRNITYSFTNMSLNVTSTSADINLWWFSLDNGLNNYSFTPNSTINGSEGSNSLLVWNNDTSNNINISSVNFTIDTIKPNITLISPSNGISSVNSAYNFTFNVSDNSEISNCGLIVDDALAGTLTGVSKDYQNGIYYSGLVVGSHTWQINCTDSAGNLENSSARSLIVTSPPVPPVTPTGGGGGGAGIVFKLKANPEFINLQSVVNSRINGTLDITNLGSSTVYLTINLIKLDGLLEMQKTLTLASGETKTLEYFVNSPKDAGIYTGKIRFAYAENSLEVPFALNVKTEISLFDISVNLPKEYKSITKGQNLKAQINLIQAGLQDKADVTVVYMIKDFESNTYLQESETMMVYKEKAYEKEFQIGTFEPGNYVIGAEVIYSGGVAAASSNFDVVGKKPFSFWMLLVVIATFIIIVVVAVRYKKIVADRINNKSKLKKRV
ncbi:MAG: LamG domain-containing protein [Candidatus Pacearchaeota archaeon]|nr:LamG domain-containing protein [Candidatus Pacearchaeota archaeon]